MSSTGSLEDAVGSARRAGTAGNEGQPSPAMTEVSLWSELTQAPTPDAFCRSWLALTARSHPAIVDAMLAFDRDRSGQLTPITRWHREEGSSGVGTDAAGRRFIHQDAPAPFADAAAALVSRIVEAPAPTVVGEGRQALIGWPISIGQHLRAVVVARATVGDDLAAKRLLRHLQWASAWVEAHVRRDGHEQAEIRAEQATTLLDVINGVAAETTLEGAARVLAVEAARLSGADRASVGWREGLSTTVLALSQTATFERKSALASAIAGAMDEAIDQAAVLAAPPRSDRGGLAAFAQARLAREGGAVSVLTLPLVAESDLVGGLTIEHMRGERLDDGLVATLEAVAAAAGPILRDKRKADRGLWKVVHERCQEGLAFLLGPRMLPAKLLASLAAALLTYSVLATDEHRIHAKIQIQGEQRRLIGAPFDGYLRAQHARAGQVVKEGDLLVEIEDNDIQLERLRHVARSRQYQLELDKALSKRELAQANIAKAQIEQTDAEIELSDHMLTRTRIRAPFDAIVVSGDLSQSIGRPVSRGDTLLELAPLDRYRVTAMVPEADIQLVHAGSTGQVLLSAIPERPLPLKVLIVTPVARATDGINAFEVIGALAEADARVRPGMEGVAKIEAGQRRLIVIWTHNFVHWLRVRLWSWLP